MLCKLPLRIILSITPAPAARLLTFSLFCLLKLFASDMMSVEAVEFVGSVFNTLVPWGAKVSLGQLAAQLAELTSSHSYSYRLLQETR